MSQSIGFLDANVLIGYFKGDERVVAAMERFAVLKLPAVAYIEFMTGLHKEHQRIAAEKVIESLFEIVHTDMDICHEAAELRRSLRLKLPDIMIYATARIGHGTLITLNTKDFKPEWDDIYIPRAAAA